MTENPLIYSARGSTVPLPGASSAEAPCVCAGCWCWLKEGTTVSGGEAVPVGGAGMLGKCPKARGGEQAPLCPT